MIGDYRIRILGGTMPKVTAQGYVNFDVWVEREIEGAEWVLVDGGHFTQQVPGALLEQCANVAEAKALIAEQVLERGLTLSDRAREALIALLPGGVWPENDIVIDV